MESLNAIVVQGSDENALSAVPTLKKAGVRYRNPYQTRHTFATKHISQGVNLFWLAGQMGHKGPEMIFRNYGKYLAEYDGKTAISAAL